MTVWDEIFTCPVCGTERCVPPAGRKDSPVLLVAEFPGDEEVLDGQPFTGRTGTIFKQQLGQLGWSLSNFRMMNLWQHPPNKNEKCLKHGIQTVIKEAQGKKGILLIGSDVAKAFTQYNVSEICGIPVESDYFSAEVIMAMVNPAIVFHGVLGELQLGLEKFLKRIEKYYD